MADSEADAGHAGADSAETKDPDESYVKGVVERYGFEQPARGYPGLATVTVPQKKGWWSATEAMTISSAVLIFGLLVIGVSAAMAFKRIDKDVILKAVIIPMVVMSAVFLVVAGYSDKQIAPLMGLLGTIVGYVLGASQNGRADSKDERGPTPPEPPAQG